QEAPSPNSSPAERERDDSCVVLWFVHEGHALSIMLPSPALAREELGEGTAFISPYARQRTRSCGAWHRRRSRSGGSRDLRPYRRGGRPSGPPQTSGRASAPPPRAARADRAPLAE